LYSSQYVFPLLSHKNHDGVLWWFFYKFQEYVAFFAQVFGAPHDEYFFATLVGLQVEDLYYFPAFFGSDVALFVFGIDVLQPVVRGAVGRLFYKLPELVHVSTAHCLIAAFFRDGGETEVEVGMFQLYCFAATGAFAAGIGFGFVFAENVLCQCQRHRQAACALGTGYEDGVGEGVVSPHF
jgi:hypothetical protein